MKETSASTWPGPDCSGCPSAPGGGSGCEPRIPPLAAGGKSQGADEFAQHLRGVVVAALHESAKPVAAGVHDIVVFHGMTTSARPCVAKGRERANSHAIAGILEGLVAQAEGGGVGDWVEPHVAGPGRNAVEECPGPVGGPKALQVGVAGCMEGAADERGQQGELGGGRCGEAICGRWAVIGECDMQVCRCVLFSFCFLQVPSIWYTSAGPPLQQIGCQASKGHSCYPRVMVPHRLYAWLLVRSLAIGLPRALLTSRVEQS
jgi:hypothetical protein